MSPIVKRRQKPVSVTRAVVQFGLASVVAVIVIGFAGIEVLKSEGHHEAYGDAKELATLAGRGIVEPHVTDALVNGDTRGLPLLDQLVHTSVLGDGIARIKIWTPQGRIVYSDVSALIGATYPLTPGELASLRTGTIVAEPNSNRSPPENRFERSLPPTVDIYLPIHTTSGRPLLFEAYLPSREVSSSARHLWVAFAPALFGGLIVLALVQLPLAWSLATRLRRGQKEREALLQRAIDASEDERRRIAGELHDGVVQDLAGATYALAATAETVTSQPPAAIAKSLRTTAGQMRQSIRALRTLLVDIYPANLRSVGLGAALSDLASGLTAHGVDVELDYSPDQEMDAGIEALLFRVAQEALRNVSSHAHASHVQMSVTTSARTATLCVVDDGQGFKTDEPQTGVSGGHLGLSVLAGLAQEQGGALEVSSQPGHGTTVRVEVPRT